MTSLPGKLNPFYGKRHPKAIRDEINRKKFATWLSKFDLTESLYSRKLQEGYFWCSEHKQFLPALDFHRDKQRPPTQCKKCISGKQLRRKFGVLLGWYDSQLEAQGGGCAICHRKDNPVRGVNALFSADHDHKTNKLRGLLCHICNAHVGWLENHGSPALEYLRHHG